MRTLNEEGRATDGLPINGGDVFRTLSGRATTPFPKQKAEKYASLWLIENATAEALARGDRWNATGFSGTKPLKCGELTPADGAALRMYLFGQQPEVPRPFLKSPVPTQARLF